MKAKTLSEQIEILRASNSERLEENNSLKRAKNALVEEKAKLERSVTSLSRLISNHEHLLKDIQRDMKTVCEAAYGHHFDPEWYGDRPDNVWQNGVEYTRAPSNNNSDMPTTSPSEYLEPIQRLVRMIWRRTHWGLNPMIDQVGRNF